MRPQKSWLTILSTIGVLGLLSGCSSASDDSAKPSAPEQLEISIVDTHPWDSTSFTQGLEVAGDGKILAGTGIRGDSRIYYTTVDGEQSDNHDLAAKYFGEGLTIHSGDDGDVVWQLTWQENTAFQRDPDTLKELNTAEYDGEGWGLCSDGDRLVMSDGSGTLSFRDPDTFEKTGEVDVTLDGEATTMLNELECDGDAVWANVWQTDDIYRIDPTSGHVTGVVDASGVFPAADKPGADVLNGIAKIPGTDRFYLTGKYWDSLYEVTFDPSTI